MISFTSSPFASVPSPTLFSILVYKFSHSLFHPSLIILSPSHCLSSFYAAPLFAYTNFPHSVFFTFLSHNLSHYSLTSFPVSHPLTSATPQPFLFTPLLPTIFPPSLPPPSHLSSSHFPTRPLDPSALTLAIYLYFFFR